MTCETVYKNPIITVNLNTLDNNKLYYFVGDDLPNNIISILNKIPNISSSDKTELKKHFTANSSSLIDSFSKKGNHNIVFDYLRLDDNLTTIKKKIFIHLSEKRSNYFVLENNQELWVEPTSKTYKLLGYEYVNKETQEPISIKPSVYYTKPQIDYDFVDKNGEISHNFDLINNNLILYDIIKLGDHKTYVLYLTNLQDFIRKMKEAGIKEIDDKLLNGYIKKFWPRGEINPDTTKALKHYNKINKTLKRNAKIIEFVNDVKIEKDRFSQCNIILVKINVNYNQKDQCIDLLKIFNHLRKKLGPKMPFLRYQDPNWPRAQSAFDKKLAKDTTISQEQLEKWLFIKEAETGSELKTPKGLTIKLFNYKHDGKNYFNNIIIHGSSRIDITLTYISNIHATTKNIEQNIKDIGDLVDDINKIRINIAGVKQKLNKPYINFKDGVMKTDENTKVVFMNTISEYELIKDVNRKDLENFGTLFTPYITFKLDKGKMENETTFVFKRVSNFMNMNEIYQDITKQLQLGKSEASIVNYIMSKYDKTVLTATELFDDYKKRFGGYGSYDLMRQIGITIVVNVNTNKIAVRSSPNLFNLIKANQFIVSMLSIYENLNKYKKNKEFRELLLKSDVFFRQSEEEDKDEVVAASNVSNVENEVENIEDLDFEDVDVGDIEDYAPGEDSNIDVEGINEMSDKQKTAAMTDELGLTKEQLEYHKGLAPESEIDPNIRLKCDDDEPIPELSICKDICNTRSYLLRRLQEHDPKLFNYELKGKKFEKYSRTCQQTKQPVVMKNDPTKDPNISKDSFTYAIKYGSSADNQNYYICPRVWCPYHQKPYPLSEVKKSVKTRMTLEGECTVAKCPEGDHEVFVFDKGEFAKSKNPAGLYPGFTAPNHPDNLCLPCCFIKNQNNPKSSKYPYYKSCLDEEEISNVESEESVKYIRGFKTTLSKGRFGLLPPDVSKMFGTNCEQGYMRKSCYLRRGIDTQDNQEFLSCIADIVSDDSKTITVKGLKHYILTHLNQKMFKSLNSGSLDLVFKSSNPKEKKTPYERFRDYLKSDEPLDERFLWDLLSRPGILEPEGMNIIIFTDSTILCPVGFVASDFYDFAKKTIFMIKTSNKYFHPIYYVKYQQGSISIQKIFSSINRIVNTIISIVRVHCIEYYDIDWMKILKDNEKLFRTQYDFDSLEHKENTLRQTVIAATLKMDLTVKYQIVDYYNKVVGIVFNNDLYVPCKPGGILIEYQTVMMDQLKLADYKKLRVFLDEFQKQTGMNTKSKYKIVNPMTNKILAIMTITGRLLPVKETIIIGDKLPVKNMPFYLNADKAIYEGKEEMDHRKEIVAKMEFESESYHRLAFELSRYLQKNPKMMKEIMKIIVSNEKINIKREKMKKILVNIFKKLVVTKKIYKDFSTYQVPNIRTVCQENKNCETDPHCIKMGSGCRLFIFPRNLLTGKDNMKMYIDRLADEILRNKTKQEDILTDKIDSIIDKQKIQPLHNEIVFLGQIDKDKEKIQQLYQKEKHIYIRDICDIGTLEPKHYGIDQDYIQAQQQTTVEVKTNLEELAIYWKNILTDSFEIYANENGDVFFAFMRALNYLYKNDQQNIIKIKQKLIDFDVPEDVINNIATVLGLNLYQQESNDDLLVRLYKYYYPNMFKNINTTQELHNLILSNTYYGVLVDIYLLSNIYNINVCVLKNRMKTGDISMRVIEQEDSHEYLLIYSRFKKTRYFYDIIEENNKYVFEKYDLPEEFRKEMDKALKHQKGKIENMKKKLPKTKIINKKVIKRKKSPKKKIIIKKNKKNKNSKGFFDFF